jgi:glucose-1-phosphate adenylyltransferase
VFSREVLFDILNTHPYVDFGKEVIPAALATHRVRPYLFDGFWADVGTMESFYEANLQVTRPDAPFRFYDPARPIFTRPRFLPGTRADGCHVHRSVIAEGCHLQDCTIEDAVVGIRSRIDRGSRVTRSVLLGADYYEQADGPPGFAAPGIGRDVVLDRVIVDKNARIEDGVHLTNAAGVDHADGEGYCIRSGLVIVPKFGVVRAGTRA